MRRSVLFVNHGLPPRYNAGSEIYTELLAGSMKARGHPVALFARHEDPYQPDYTMHKEVNSDGIPVYLMNHARSNVRFGNQEIDAAFENVLVDVQPSIVHFGHLNHLSTGMVDVAKRHSDRVVFTLHDFWLMCPRGQFLRHSLTSGAPWELCTKQIDATCASQCYNRYDDESGVDYWADWIGRRMDSTRSVRDSVDAFISPSTHLKERFVTDFGVPSEKISVLDYGFDTQFLSGRERVKESPFVFGYTGRQHFSKGIDLLLKAFVRLPQSANVRLRVWGRPDPIVSPALKRLATGDSRIEFLPEYTNNEVMSTVMNHCDAIVVPSVWDENSPLVIHEAQQAAVPVITADHCGMSEFVQHGVNGLLFEHRDVNSLSLVMQEAVGYPDRMTALGKRGYLHSEDHQVVKIQDHAARVEQLYANLFPVEENPYKPLSAGPVRITFDTNPDTCNLTCTMCEEHSPYSPSRQARLRAGRNAPKRLMDFHVIERVIEECSSTLREIIPSTMGEPLMYSHFEKIVDLCYKHNIKMNLTTNGTFVGHGARVWAERLVPICSDVKISWNGASETVHRSIMLGTSLRLSVKRLGQFLAVRDAHEVATGHRCSVTLQLTFLESNLEEIPKIVALALEKGVDRVKGHHLWAHFDEIAEQDLRRSSDSRTRWNAVAAECRALVAGKPLKLEHFEDLGQDSGALLQETECPFLGREAWVNHAGRFDPCCAPDKQRQSLGSFGTVEQGMLPIWNSKGYRELVANYKDQSLCKTCTMRRPIVQT